MFYSRAIPLTLEHCTEQTDELNFTHKNWVEDDSPALVAVVEKGATAYRTNELNLTESQYVGYTRDERCIRGVRLGGRYIVDYCAPTRTGYALSMSAFGGHDEQ